MQQQTHSLAGDQISVYFWEAGDDLQPVYDLVAREPVTGFDTEGTGTEVYDPDWRMRLVQFGNQYEGHVLQVGPHDDIIRELVNRANALAAHKADFDAHSLNRALGIPLVDIYPKLFCTMNMSRIIDPMGYTVKGQKGKIIPKHDLKNRIRQLIDGEFDLDKALADEFARLKLRGGRGWRDIPSDNLVYWLYAGLDPVLAVRAYRFLLGLSTQADRDLVEYERRVSYAATPVTQTGQLVDVEFTRQQAAHLRQHAEESFAAAEERGWPVRGVATAKDKAALGEYLVASGVTMPRTEPSKTHPDGQDSFKKDLLLAAVKEADNPPLLDTFTTFQTGLESIKVEKDYLQKFLRCGLQGDGRLHPWVGTLSAQTGRQSIYGQLPAQQMPRAGDVRGCAVADEGRVLVTCDLAQVEVRVGAALSGDRNLIDLLVQGVDVMDVLARQQYGEGFADEQRNNMKRSVYGRLYGAGAYTVSSQCGISEDEARACLATVDRMAPGLKRYARSLADQRFVTTAYGRRVAVDTERSWGAINYEVQGTARDVWMQTVFRVIDAGMGGWIWLFVHDETILNVPVQHAERVRARLEQLMSGTFKGVPIEAKATILGKRWVKV